MVCLFIVELAIFEKFLIVSSNYGWDLWIFSYLSLDLWVIPSVLFIESAKNFFFLNYADPTKS